MIGTSTSAGPFESSARLIVEPISSDDCTFARTVETKRFRQSDKIHGIRLPAPVPSVLVEFRANLPANEVVLPIADRDIAGVVQNQEHDRDVVHGTYRQLLHAHHEITVANNADHGESGLASLAPIAAGSAKPIDENEPDVIWVLGS